ncbi:subtilisin family serine protease [Krasilnikovia cinnamomea]|uniref:Subtilisin family serine protease n=1 Tax=Krasilnikovia cinnamomea TaxID=349313 RepID=A0A4Q7ZS89_9ACTN|nr:S8 family serine peptidase [Krasilnikovia cinnamomea]RZU53329.1 subtilisin family serine protease [Krasilnikovia cinnamomea]
MRLTAKPPPRLAWIAFLAAILAMPLSLGAPAAAATRESGTPGPTSTFFVLLKSRPDLRSAPTRARHADRTRYVYETAKANADNSQAGLRRLLTDRNVAFTAYWITNAIKVTGTKDLMTELRQRPEVRDVVPDRSYHVVQPVAKKAAGTRGTEWNIDRVRAPEVWQTYGVRGDGIVVGTIDTGAQYDHPAIARQYRGAPAPGTPGTLDHQYSWFDPSYVCGNPSETPCDNVGHGTHVLGTVLGNDGAGNETGVAPGARWIAAKGCETNDCSLSALLASGQWMVAPTDLSGANPRPDLAPDIINNSWGSNGQGDPFYADMVATWRAAGIFATFAVGNDDGNCNTAFSPGDYDNTYAVGSFNAGNNASWFSGRGPTLDGRVKPDIAAPGEDIRSSVPGGRYEAWSGTSMATPHVTGTVALMWSAARALPGDVTTTTALLDQSAVDTDNEQCGGIPQDNNVFGEGRLDAYEAVTRSPRGPVGGLAGTVRSGGQALPDTTITATGPQTRTARSDAQGSYALPSLPVGRYTVTAWAFGYRPQEAGVDITEEVTSSQDFDLEVAARHVVSGNVDDDTGAPVSGATVHLVDTPLPAVSTDAQGAFRIPDVPDGEYDLSVARGHCLLPQRVHVHVFDDEIADVTMPHRSDDAGHVCETVAPDWVDTDTVLPLQGDDASAPLTLPFPVTLYDQQHVDGYVTTNGFVSFTSSAPILGNQPIPNTDEPNGAVYAFWDDLVVSDGATVRTGLTGTAPDRRFAVEWRDVWILGTGPNARVTAEIVFHENGQIVLQYRGIGDDPAERGASATVGIENEQGTSALQYSSDQQVLADDTAILIHVPGTGMVRGTVTDANDGGPVAGAQVTVVQSGQPQRSSRTDDAGRYQLRMHVGTATLRAERDHYQSGQAQVSLEREGEIVVRDFSLRTARVTVTAVPLQIVAPAGQQRQRTLTLGNTGVVASDWQIKESGGAAALSPARVNRPAAFDADARTSRGLPATVRSTAAPAAVGEVLASWPATGLQIGWGIGQERSNIWISDGPGVRNGSFTLDGTPRSEGWPTPWSGQWAADMAYLPARQMVCQVAVGADNGIYCWNPRTGTVEQHITGPDWTRISQRGLAYRADDDSFYIGGWNEGVIYHIKGPGHPDAGALIGQCSPADRTISGLSWNDAFGRLWMATNSETDRIYSLNPDTCETLSTLAPPDTNAYTGGGLETDPGGNLWYVSQGSPSTVSLIDSGMPNFTDVPWLTVTPATGTLAPGEQRQLTVNVDTTGLAPGRYGATIFVQSDSGRDPTLTVPITLVVPKYQAALNAGGGSYTDTGQDRWEPDRAYTPGGFGYLTTVDRVDSTLRTINGTADQPLYRHQRERAYEYRFDGVPNGVYRIDLKFAELQPRLPNTRLFDVIVEDRLEIPALDVAGAVGSLTALDRTLTVTVTDGQLNVRLVNRRGGTIINAIRVTERPDLVR